MFSFRPNDTESQKIFDLIFGIVAPILCLILDPIIFKPGDPCFFDSFLAPYSTFAYAAVGLGIAALLAWMAARRGVKSASPFFAGIFFTGFLFSLSIGIAILPLSLAGLVFAGLGLLGFIPFLTALVYFRNGVQAARDAREEARYLPAVRVALLILGVVFALGLPAYAQYRYPPATHEIVLNCYAE